jgi:hypothetical protein
MLAKAEHYAVDGWDMNEPKSKKWKRIIINKKLLLIIK